MKWVSFGSIYQNGNKIRWQNKHQCYFLSKFYVRNYSIMQNFQRKSSHYKLKLQKAIINSFCLWKTETNFSTSILNRMSHLFYTHSEISRGIKVLTTSFKVVWNVLYIFFWYCKLVLFWKIPVILSCFFVSFNLVTM